ncbi:fasciclin domain-containing protein [Flectobacillus roseus]|uniref:Fasciclin domain-containing protein n=1 Tax=Flectobacillus roseus TaxID=502259 RepID=A0ABT6Y3W6_9BACT|nr:fasciclin domain-containing protein [Flectobacillus roseus]MDI9858263.1 fasciclin domain-containing protein [Flectobacillus roseus]
MMHRYSIRYWLVLSVLISTFLGSCTKEELDIYKRPETLEPPIYQVLTKRGNFKTLLGVIDKSGYQRTLSSAGYWTFFAPNDDAFNKYFTSAGLSLNALDSTKAREIVQGLLVFNAFDKNRLADYQAPTGWQDSRAFRRKTAYYTGFYDEKSFDGNSFKSVATNRQNGSYIVGDNNNKHISYFTDEYLSARGLTAADYNYFYPNVNYSGFNVMNSKVVNADIFAENGMIHEIDDVPTVQPSIDEYIRNKPEYSVFRNLIEKYAATYGLNDAMTIKYANLTGKGDKIYVKNYNKQASSSKYLTFAPNCENFSKIAENDAQLDMWSIFVPTNDVLTPYINSVLLENYKSLDAMPPGIIIDLINAHLFPSTVWPTKFQNSFNALGEEARFNANANVVEKKILSNAMFYGTNKVQESNLFSSVYSKSYLDPKYSMMTRILDMDWKNTILNPRVNYVLFMISDDLFKAAGYDYDISKSVANVANSEWGYTAPGTTTRTSGTSILANLQRIVATSVVYTPNKELDNLSGSGVIDAINGEYIRFDGNKVYSTGTKTAPLSVLGSKTASNGKVYYTNGVLNFAPANTTVADPIGKDLSNLAPTLNSDFGYFFEYLKNSSLYTAATFAISNVSEGTFYTLFIPNNAAIQAAVNDGVLPGTGTGATKTPVYNPTSLLDKKKVEDFINYHILNKKAVATDGKESGAMETLLKDANGDAVNVTVLNSKGAMSLSDAKLRKATVIVNKSNNLSNRAVIHLIDNYLKSN